MDLAVDLPGLFARTPSYAWVSVGAVLVLQRLVMHAGMWAYAVFALPGTAAHESAHWLVALVTGARPQWPRLWPMRSGHGWRLGSVAFRPAWWRTGLIALAPLALAPLAVAWTVGPVSTTTGAWIAVHAWIAGTLLNASLPSATDLRLAAPTLAAAVGALGVWGLTRF